MRHDLKVRDINFCPCKSQIILDIEVCIWPQIRYCNARNESQNIGSMGETQNELNGKISFQPPEVYM